MNGYKITKENNKNGKKEKTTEKDKKRQHNI